MTPDLKRRAETLAEEAKQLPSTQREGFVRDQAGEDTALIETTLGALASEAETVLVGSQTSAITQLSDPGATILGTGLRSGQKSHLKAAGFQIEGLLAQGGMGAVYKAVQIGEGFKRTVAVKVVKPELATSSIMQRFFQERQVLGSLDHPNIARLLDAGTMEDGTPYLAMEFVEGQRLDEYCAARQLSTVARLKLFLQVCDAVQYAHQRLVVHRDLKPGNIMVTSEGVPKLLDFGIAKLLDDGTEESAERAQLTKGDQSPMTPMYASPEQAKHEPITTSSDLYSLGIILYELLTGSLPYEFKQFTPAAVERTICETEPARPSLAPIKRQLFAGETAERVQKRLRGELELILLMALRKEPERRYASVYQFADDIKRHLSGDPVLAHGDSMRYRVRKFVTRHRAGVAAAALAVLALTTATIVSVHFAQVATSEKAIADRRFQETRELARYFLTDLDDAIRSGETAARRELVNKGIVYLQRLSKEAVDDPEILRDVIAGYLKMGDIQGNPFGPNLGQPEGARKSYREALDLAKAHPAEFRLELARARRKLAEMDAGGGKPAAALTEYQAVLPAFQGLERSLLLYQIGFAYAQTGKSKEALEHYRGAEQEAAKILEKDPASREAQDLLARTAERIGQMLWQLGDIEGAVASLQAALQIHERHLREAPRGLVTQRRVYSTSTILGDVLASANRVPEAERHYRRAVEVTNTLRQADPSNRQHRIDWFTAAGRLADLLATQPARMAEGRSLTQEVLRTLKPIVEGGTASDSEAEQYAWLLLTSPFADLRNPAAALPIVEKASQKRGGQIPRLLDMLALAQFGVGQRQQAIETEKRALALLPPTPSPTRTELEANLKRFERSAAPAAQRR